MADTKLGELDDSMSLGALDLAKPLELGHQHTDITITNFEKYTLQDT